MVLPAFLGRRFGDRKGARGEDQSLTPELVDWALAALEALLRCADLPDGSRDLIRHVYKRLDDLWLVIARKEARCGSGTKP